MKRKARNFKWVVAGFLMTFLLMGCGGSGDSDGTSASGVSGRAGGAIISSTVDSPSEMEVGDLMAISLTADTSIDFSGVDSSWDFIMVVGSHATSGSGSSILVSSESSYKVEEVAKTVSKEMLVENDGFDANAILSSWLRAAEFDLSQKTDEMQGVGKSLATVAKGAFSDTQAFRVLNSLSSLSSYTEVTATRQYSGDKIDLFIDTRAVDKFTADQISTLGSEYDRSAQFEYSLFGSPSDVNGDGKVVVLLTPQINYLGNLAGGIITGFFYAADLYERTSSNAVSNYSEIVYALVPDPDGEYGVSISTEFAMANLLPSVVPHEVQHLISYNQHVFENGGSPEESWLNEGLSHFSEDLVGYNLENPSRYALFLSDTANTGLVTSGSPDLEERGASYLFLRYLYEQSSDGDAFLKRLVQSGSTGVDNLEEAFAGPEDFDEFSEFITRWTVAIAVTDRGVTQDSRYVFGARGQHSLTGNWTGACMICSAEDGRDTALDGPYMVTYQGSARASVDSSAAKYYSITTVPSSIALSSSSGTGNFAILIRVR